MGSKEWPYSLSLWIVILISLLVACSPESKSPSTSPTETTPEGKAQVTLIIDQGLNTQVINQGINTQGVPRKGDDLTGDDPAVVAMELVVLDSDGNEILFDKNNNISTAPSASRIIPVPNTDVVLILPTGTYSFKLLAYDDAIDSPTKIVLAYGESLNEFIDATKKNELTIGLNSIIATAQLSSSPEEEIIEIATDVNPNVPVDIFIYVHPENHNDYFVPEGDYTVEYKLGTQVLEGSQVSQIGARFPLGCVASTFQATVTGLQLEEGDYVEKVLEPVTLGFTPSPGCTSIAGVDIVRPHVKITTEEDVSFAGTVTLEGEVVDMQSGVDRVEIYEGPILLGEATIDDSTDIPTWSFEWTPPKEGSYSFTAIAFDVEGNTNRDSVQVRVGVEVTECSGETKLTAPDGEEGDYYGWGWAVSISGNTMVTGNHFNDAGSAHIHERTACGGWKLNQKIEPSNGAFGDRFGYAVSISGNTIAVATPWDNSNGGILGSVYIFERNLDDSNDWVKVKEILPSDSVNNDYFGISVDVSGDTLVVGTGFNNSGPAYIFERNSGGSDNWGQVKKILSSINNDPSLGQPAYGGKSVSISGDTIVVGNRLDDVNGSNSGSAYLFKRNHGGINNWGQVAKLTASDGASNERFGFSVAISGSTVVVGAVFDALNGGSTGSAYIFEYNDGSNNWEEIEKIVPSDGVSHWFGFSTAILGDTIAVGAVKGNPGSIYVYERNDDGNNDWDEGKKIVASDGTAGEHFGLSVALSEGIMVVGSYSSVYIYE